MRNIVLHIFKSLHIASDKVIGDILVTRGLVSWSAGTSARNNTRKLLKTLDLEEGNGYFRIPGCKSEYCDHAKALTEYLAEILKITDAEIFREHTLPINLKPDALVLAQKDGKKSCFILEVALNETPEYLEMKYNAWLQWKEAKTYLSDLFKVKIPHIGFVVAGKEGKYTTFQQLTDFLKGETK